MPRCQPKLSVDRAIDLIASERRRQLLRYLLEKSDPICEREELVECIRDEDDMELDTLEIALVHHHLPKLEEAGVIEYDQRSGVVRPTKTLEAVGPLLETCDELENSLR